MKAEEIKLGDIIWSNNTGRVSVICENNIVYHKLNCGEASRVNAIYRVTRYENIIRVDKISKIIEKVCEIVGVGEEEPWQQIVLHYFKQHKISLDGVYFQCIHLDNGVLSEYRYFNY